MNGPQLQALDRAANVTDAAALAWVKLESVSERTAAKLAMAHEDLWPECCSCPQCRGKMRRHPGGRRGTTRAAILHRLMRGPAMPSDIWRDEGLSPTGVPSSLAALKREGIVYSQGGRYRIHDEAKARAIIDRCAERSAA